MDAIPKTENLRLTYGADDFFSGRIDGCEGLATDRIHKLIVDEQLSELDLWDGHFDRMS